MYGQVASNFQNLHPAFNLNRKYAAGIKAGFQERQSRSPVHNQKGRTLQSSENSVLILLILLMTLSFTIK